VILWKQIKGGSAGLYCFEWNIGYRTGWEIPKGGIKSTDQGDRDTAARELKEEAQVIIGARRPDEYWVNAYGERLAGDIPPDVSGYLVVPCRATEGDRELVEGAARRRWMTTAQFHTYLRTRPYDHALPHGGRRYDQLNALRKVEKGWQQKDRGQADYGTVAAWEGETQWEDTEEDEVEQEWEEQCEDADEEEQEVLRLGYTMAKVVGDLERTAKAVNGNPRPTTARAEGHEWRAKMRIADDARAFLDAADQCVQLMTEVLASQSCADICRIYGGAWRDTNSQPPDRPGTTLLERMRTACNEGVKGLKEVEHCTQNKVIARLLSGMVVIRRNMTRDDDPEMMEGTGDEYAGADEGKEDDKGGGGKGGGKRTPDDKAQATEGPKTKVKKGGGATSEAEMGTGASGEITIVASGRQAAATGAEPRSARPPERPKTEAEVPPKARGPDPPRGAERPMQEAETYQQWMNRINNQRPGIPKAPSPPVAPRTPLEVLRAIEGVAEGEMWGVIRQITRKEMSMVVRHMSKYGQQGTAPSEDLRELQQALMDGLAKRRRARRMMGPGVSLDLYEPMEGGHRSWIPPMEGGHRSGTPVVFTRVKTNSTR